MSGDTPNQEFASPTTTFQTSALSCTFQFLSPTRSLQSSKMPSRGIFKLVFEVDGVCRNNGYPDAYGAVAACRMRSSGGYGTMTARLVDTPTPTNQHAELTAVLNALL